MDKSKLSKFFNVKEMKQTQTRLNKMLEQEMAVTGNDSRLQFPVLPTFSIGLNHYLEGGYRRRKMHLVYGDKSAGKSFGDYKTTAILQRLCRHCIGVLPFEGDRLCDIIRIFFLRPDCTCKNPEAHRICRIDYESDYEHVSDPEDTPAHQKKMSHAEKIGVIPEFLTVVFAGSIEDCIDIAKDVIAEKSFDYLSVDSIQGAQNEYVMGKEGAQDTMGVDAKRITNLLRSMMASFQKFGVDAFKDMPVVNIISQLRMKIGPTLAFASYSGGKALEHEMSYIGKQARESYITTDGNPVTGIGNNKLCGLRIGYHNEKSKLAIPYFSGELDLYFRDAENLGFQYGDIDYFREAYKIGIATGSIVKESGGNYTIGTDKFKGMVELREEVSKRADLVSKIMSRAPKYLEKPVEDDTPEITEDQVISPETEVPHEETPKKKPKKSKK